LQEDVHGHSMPASTKATSSARSTTVALNELRELLVETKATQTTGPKTDFREHLDLLIIVPSHWSESARRCGIRDSWMQYFLNGTRCQICQRYRVLSIFTVGNSTLNQSAEDRAKFFSEYHQFGDIVILNDFAESEQYKQRSMKTLSSMRHAVDHFNFTLLLKTDTDSYIFGDRLLNFLHQNEVFSSRSRMYIGNFFDGTGAKVVTDERVKRGKADKGKAKWVDDTFHNLTGLDTYPKHAKGPGYILSHTLVQYLAHPPIPFAPFTCEDTAIGAYLMATNHTKFAMPVYLSPQGCDSTDAVIDHYVQPHLMRRRWRRFVVLGDACSAPVGLSTDPKHAACAAGDSLKPIAYWRLSHNHAGPELDGELLSTAGSEAHCSTRSGVCSLRFVWRKQTWGLCQHASCWMEGVQWRCLQCIGSDGHIYDDWECAFSTMPSRTQRCDNWKSDAHSTCEPLYDLRVRKCFLNQSAAAAAAPAAPAPAPKQGMSVALHVLKTLLDQVAMPFVIDPWLVSRWESTCSWPAETELTVFVMHRYAAPGTLLQLEARVKQNGLQHVMTVKKTHDYVGYMLALSCPSLICGVEVFIHLKIAEEVLHGMWWPLWQWGSNVTVQQSSTSTAEKLEMLMCTSQKPSNFQVIQENNRFYLAGVWPESAEVVCVDTYDQKALTFQVVWENEDNIGEFFVKHHTLGEQASTAPQP